MSTKSKLRNLENRLQSVEYQVRHQEKLLREAGLSHYATYASYPGYASMHLAQGPIKPVELQAKVNLILKHLNLCYKSEHTYTEEVEAKLTECEAKEDV